VRELETRFIALETRRRTELDARVILADLVARVVGEEHVGGETTLGCVGVCTYQ